jgi:hypothetical protein
MADKFKPLRGTAYDLNSISRERVEDRSRTAQDSRKDSPYTLRKEYALSTLRSKLEKHEPN